MNYESKPPRNLNDCMIRKNYKYIILFFNTIVHTAVQYKYFQIKIYNNATD